MVGWLARLGKARPHHAIRVCSPLHYKQSGSWWERCEMCSRRSFVKTVLCFLLSPHPTPPKKEEESEDREGKGKEGEGKGRRGGRRKRWYIKVAFFFNTSKLSLFVWRFCKIPCHSITVWLVFKFLFSLTYSLCILLTAPPSPSPLPRILPPDPLFISSEWVESPLVIPQPWFIMYLWGCFSPTEAKQGSPARRTYPRDRQELLG